MLNSIIFFLGFITTFFGVELFRQWSLKKGFLDFPNERSSHTKPTPIGGGVIIVLVTNLLFFTYTLSFAREFSLFFFIGSNLVALISWFDDVFSIPSGWRIVVHTFAAGLAVYGLGFWKIVYLPFFGDIYIGSFGAFITILWIVWLTNAFNFMDGIDGLAGTQALTAGLGWFLVSLIFGFENAGLLAGIIAFSGLGFLIHNWQPAKIFMGDVGSAFLGYVFAVIPFLAKNESTFENQKILPFIAIVLVWMFFLDSFITFVKRLLRGEKVWVAHREHIYQRLSIKGISHQKITLYYGLVSIIIVFLLIFWLNQMKVFGVLLLLFLLASTFTVLLFSIDKTIWKNKQNKNNQNEH